MPLDDVHFFHRRSLLDEIHQLVDRDRALLWNAALSVSVCVFCITYLGVAHLQWWWMEIGLVPGVFTGVMLAGSIFSLIKAVSFAERRRYILEGLSAARFRLMQLQVA